MRGTPLPYTTKAVNYSEGSQSLIPSLKVGLIKIAWEGSMGVKDPFGYLSPGGNVGFFGMS